MAERPLVGKSAGLSLPGTWRHWSGSVVLWISPTLFATKGLKVRLWSQTQYETNRRLALLSFRNHTTGIDGRHDLLLGVELVKTFAKCQLREPQEHDGNVVVHQPPLAVTLDLIRWHHLDFSRCSLGGVKHDVDFGSRSFFSDDWEMWKKLLVFFFFGRFSDVFLVYVIINDNGLLIAFGDFWIFLQ